MKNLINYYYNLFPENISKKYGGFYFEIYQKRYILTDIKTSEEEILSIYEKLMMNNIKHYVILYNKESKIITEYEEKQYILFEINCDPQDILKFDEQLYIKADKEINWSSLWSERIDYYEIQINELAQGKKLVLHSVYYYIGLAENAITIANKFEKNIYEECAIQHFRMHAPITKGSYFNPSNMLIDVSIRDVAEYIKSSFFIEKRDTSYYIDYIKNVYLTDITANLLLARLMYPSYYFDIFDDVILTDRNENDLISVIHYQEDYETFLIEVYSLLVNNYQIININWLRNRPIFQR